MRIGRDRPQNTAPYTALKESTGIGMQVKNTHSSKKDLRPHASDIAPISGADKKDSRPYGGWYMNPEQVEVVNHILQFTFTA